MGGVREGIGKIDVVGTGDVCNIADGAMWQMGSRVGVAGMDIVDGGIVRSMGIVVGTVKAGVHVVCTV